MTTSNKFKVQGVGIDTSNMVIKPWNEENGEIYDYIHTSISSNNDFLISDYVKSQPGASLITTINFINNSERAILGHILELGRNKVDLLLISSDALIRSSENAGEIISSLKTSKLIEEFGVSNPSSVEHLKEIENAVGEKVKFISLNICPLNFNYDIIKYAEENNISILGFNPFGGYISAGGVISSFTIPYLLAFSSTYSTIVFLSGRNLLDSIDSREYIKSNIIGSESSSKFILKKSVSRLYKPFKKVVDTSIMLGRDIILSYDIPIFMYPLKDICITLGKTYNMIPKISEKSRTSTEENVYNLLSITDFPEGISLDDKYAISRYQVLSIIRVKYPKEDGWNINLVNFGNRILGIGVVREVIEKKKRFWKGKKKEESNCFILGIPDNDTILFMENPDLKNTSLGE